MKDIEYIISSDGDIDSLMNIRLEMLKEVNHLGESYRFDDDFVSECRKYFLEGKHTTVLAMDDGRVIGCASICYLEMMPTYDHPTGKRAQLMNVYTSASHRRRGIAKRMIRILTEEAHKHGVTEIRLDATVSGRELYRKCGFAESDECMVSVG